MMIPPAAATIPHIKSGRPRVLAITFAKPYALAPGLLRSQPWGAWVDEVLILGVLAPAETTMVHTFDSCSTDE